MRWGVWPARGKGIASKEGEKRDISIKWSVSLIGWWIPPLTCGRLEERRRSFPVFSTNLISDISNWIFAGFAVYLSSFLISSYSQQQTFSSKRYGSLWLNVGAREQVRAMCKEKQLGSSLGRTFGKYASSILHRSSKANVACASRIPVASVLSVQVTDSPSF